eukprot:365945-Chlamydomonas_euryale.AAC.10
MSVGTYNSELQVFGILVLSCSWAGGGFIECRVKVDAMPRTQLGADGQNRAQVWFCFLWEEMLMVVGLAVLAALTAMA